MVKKTLCGLTLLCINLFSLAPSSEVLYRDTADGGFSKGWKAHERATLKELFDVHTHFDSKAQTLDKAQAVLHFWEGELSEFDVMGCAVMGGPESLRVLCQSQVKESLYVYPFLWLNYDKPDTALLHQLINSHQIYGVKLHNNRIYKAGADYKIMGSAAWDSVYALCGRAGLPILWHLNQRYRTDRAEGETGAFWSKLPYTNQEVLNHFFAIAKRHPNTKFILAHFNFLGYAQLGKLLDAYPNVYTEGSSSWSLSVYENLSPKHQKEARTFAMQYADRLLFGTDFFLIERKKANDPVWQRHYYMSYIRFLMQLDLPQDILDKISHRNAYQLLRIRQQNNPE